MKKDFKSFISKNNIFNFEKRRLNGNLTGQNTYFYKKHLDVFNEFLKFHSTDDLTEAILLEFNLIQKKSCLVCGNPTPYKHRKRNYSDCCSSRCASINVSEKRKKTNIARYGSSHPMKSAHIREKQKETNLKRYGVGNVFAVPEIQQKLKETNLKRYGVEYPSQSVEIHEKAKKTTRRNYGVDFPVQNVSIKQKIKETNLKKYGDNTYQPIKNKENLNAEFIVNNLLNNDGNLEIETILDYYECSRNYWVTKIRPLIAGEVTIVRRFGKTQSEIANFIRKHYNGSIIQDDREKLNGLELDIYLPDLNFAIEFNGNYWHSFNPCNKDVKNKHVEKTNLCENQGITLFHIWEYEWDNARTRSIIKSMILNKLNKNTKIYARNCEIREVSTSESKEFCETNHIQGNANASVKCGLYYKNKLVFLMTFGKPRFNKNYDWELIRSCSLKHHTVVGGFQKLLNHFQKNQKPSSLITYANRAYSSGDVYEKTGFRKLKNTPPSYSYWKPNTKTLLSRYQTQKHKLKNVLEHFNPNESEKKNMQNNGFRILYDCGNKIFIL